MRLFSLQVGPGTRELAAAAFPVTELGSRFGPNSLADLAAVLMNLDLVITIDCAVAHLAGARRARLDSVVLRCRLALAFGMCRQPLVSDDATFPSKKARRLDGRAGTDCGGSRRKSPMTKNFRIERVNLAAISAAMLSKTGRQSPRLFWRNRRKLGYHELPPIKMPAPIGHQFQCHHAWHSHGTGQMGVPMCIRSPPDPGWQDSRQIIQCIGIKSTSDVDDRKGNVLELVYPWADLQTQKPHSLNCG